MAEKLTEKKYLDITGVGVIKNYIDQQDNKKVDTETYNGLVQELGAEVLRSTQADAKHTEDIAANALAITTETNRAKEAEAANAKAAADALAEAQAKVASVAAGDKSITVDGTTAPTVAVAISKDADNALSLANDGLKVVIPDETDYTVTVTESSPTGYAKAYTITQVASGLNTTINIPKDMVVSSGEVVTNPAGQAAGTYLVLTLANATNDKVYINVTDLIEYVTGGNTDEINVAVSANHVVTATINDKSIAIGKLAQGIQDSLGLANTAIQSVKVLNKTLTNGDELTVGEAQTALGLGSAAYTNSEAYDAAGSAKAVYDAIVPYTTEDIRAIFFPVSE